LQDSGIDERTLYKSILETENKVVDHTKLAQNMIQWWNFVKTVMNLWVP